MEEQDTSHTAETLRLAGLQDTVITNQCSRGPPESGPCVCCSLGWPHSSPASGLCSHAPNLREARLDHPILSHTPSWLLELFLYSFPTVLTTFGHTICHLSIHLCIYLSSHPSIYRSSTCHLLWLLFDSHFWNPSSMSTSVGFSPGRASGPRM